MQKAAIQECHISEPTEENPKLMLDLLVAYIKNHCEEGDVESAVRRARTYLEAAGLTPFTKIEIANQLNMLLRQGYLAAAENNLIEARLICGVTDVWGYIARIRFFLDRAGIDEKEWLEEQGSSVEEIELLLLEGRISRKTRLQEAREKAQEKMRQDSI
jgi:hypothetical protein